MNVLTLEPSEKTIEEKSSVNLPSSASFTLSPFSREELEYLINRDSRSKTIIKLSLLLRTLIMMGEYRLSGDDHGQFLKLLDVICGARPEPKWSELAKLPIRFKDSVGRKFIFSRDLCKTWKVCSYSVFVIRKLHYVVYRVWKN
jgi:hypothetical protein